MCSRFASETLTMSCGIDNAIFPATLFFELTTGDAEHAVPVICTIDNHSLDDALKSTKSVIEKRPHLEISSIKELIQTQKVEQVLWYNTKEQLMDGMTIKGASAL